MTLETIDYDDDGRIITVIPFEGGMGTDRLACLYDSEADAMADEEDEDDLTYAIVPWSELTPEQQAVAHRNGAELLRRANAEDDN